MPPSAIVHGGTLPLNSFSFRRKSKSRTSPPHEFTWELMLDSTRLLSGLLKSYGNVVEYAIATSGSKTVISRPSRSTNVAVIEWKEGWVETEELRTNQNEWMDVSKWTSSQAHVSLSYGVWYMKRSDMEDFWPGVQKVGEEPRDSLGGQGRRLGGKGALARPLSRLVFLPLNRGHEYQETGSGGICCPPWCSGQSH
jgi:hypothetical protein